MSPLRTGGHLAVSQLLLSLSSLAITSLVAREGDKVTAAVFFGAYALESVGVSAARGYTMMTLIARSGTSSLSRTDATATVRASLNIGAVTALVVFCFVAGVAEHDLRFAATVSAWCLSIQVFDSLRPLTGLYASGRTSQVVVSVNLAAQLIISVGANRWGLTLSLVASSAVFIAMTAALSAQLLRAASADCVGVIKNERHFARTQLLEQGGSASLIALTMITLATTSPSAAVALQLAGQLVSTPVLLLLNSAGMAALRDISARALANVSYARQRNRWMLFGTCLFVAATGLGVFEPGILQRAFGDGWNDARALAPFLSIFSLCTFYAQVASHPYRSSAAPTLFRNWTLAATMSAQAALVVGGSTGGVTGLAFACLAGSALVVACYARLVHQAKKDKETSQWLR